LGCFKMFRDVLGDQLQPIQTPFQESNPFHKEKILHPKNIAKNSLANLPDEIRQRITLFPGMSLKVTFQFNGLRILLFCSKIVKLCQIMSKCVKMCQFVSNNVKKSLNLQPKQDLFQESNLKHKGKKCASSKRKPYV